MLYLVVADIFGRTPALEQLCQKLNGEYQIVDPYQGKAMNFADERCAYQYFMAHLGCARYAQILANTILAKSQPSTILAFSVGATATWLVSEQQPAQYIDKAWLFYGTQIRHHLDITPKFPLHLIMATAEASFSLRQQQPLQDKHLVTLSYADYLHGFMNHCSVNYNGDGYQSYLRKINAQAALTG